MYTRTPPILCPFVVSEKATAACSSGFNSACPRDSLMELSCAQVRLIPSAECTQDPANCPEHGNVPESLQSEVPQRKTLLYRKLPPKTPFGSAADALRAFVRMGCLLGRGVFSRLR